MYDIFYVSKSAGNNEDWLKIKSRYSHAQRLSNIKTYQEIKDRAFTKLFWVIWDDIELNNSFDLTEYRATKWDDTYVHIFKNGEYYDGLCLFPKNSDISNREFLNRFFINKKEVDVQASFPKPFEKFYINSYEEYLKVLENVVSEMFWVVWDDIEILPEFKFDYYIPKYDHFHRNITHVFKNSDHYDGVCLFSKHQKVSKKEFFHRFFTDKKEIDIQASTPKKYKIYSPKTYDEYLSIEDDMFWVVWPEIEIIDEKVFDFYFSHHNSYDRKENHTFKHLFNDKEININGITLFSKEKKISSKEFKHRFLITKKEHDILASRHRVYDIVFISYNESNADENYKRLIDRYPRAKRVHGVKGIHQAHINAAELCETDMIWIVDGDAVIQDDFSFDLVMSSYDLDCVHVWRSKNPVNELEYGNGGVKLLPRELTLNMEVDTPDMTTSISKKFKVMDEVSNINAFNTDPFSTWRSAFRECCKLASKIIERQDDTETLERLDIWCEKSTDEYALDGARSGKEYGSINKNNIDALKKINDFVWLREQFDGRYNKN